ncbi:hypothetical protein AcV5_002130 [Taiwanofungus camphoratus]|nr:hypothetical protein AcV5_002130 [Antrodia cinnamomea]
MAPTRHDDLPSSTPAQSTSKYSAPKAKHNLNGKKVHGYSTRKDASSPLALPGVQKIKASLRQTRRLLAKDNVAADVRMATERRLKALEADLEQAEHARKERVMAVRYHRIKFFERQKVMRRIHRIKRQFSQGPGSEGDEGNKLDKKDRKKLERQLEELRVDLNYILNYPKTKKYISLFPPELRAESHAAPDPYPHTTSKAKSKSDSTMDSVTSQSETDAQREAVRAWIRERIAAGDMSATPEIEMQEHAKSARAPSRDALSNPRKREKGASTHRAMAKETSKKGVGSVGGKGVKSDAFFGDEEEEEADGSGYDDAEEDEGSDGDGMGQERDNDSGESSGENERGYEDDMDSE